MFNNMLLFLIKFWFTSNNTIFNTTFVVATTDFEVSFISPIFIPCFKKNQTNFIIIIINKSIHLQLATSQYGDEFSTPQPRILTAVNKRRSIIKYINKRNTYRVHREVGQMCVYRHLICMEENRHRQRKQLRRVHLS
jgi:hypothetical protein